MTKTCKRFAVTAAVCLGCVAQVWAQKAEDPNDKLMPPAVAMSPMRAVQGYAADGTLHYLSDTSVITAYDAQWNVVWQNKDPFAGMFKDEPQINESRKAEGLPILHKHVGDIDAYDGKIYAPVESYNSCQDNVVQKIAVYSAKDGSFLSYTDVAEYKHEISSIAVVPSKGSMYVTSFCESWEIPQYDLKTMKPLEALKLDYPISKMQGISWSEKRKMFVVTSDSPAQKFGYVWGVTPEGHVTLLFTAPQIGEMEGVDYTQDQIRYLLKHVWFLDPAIGRDVKPLPTGWNWAITTTGEISPKGMDGLKRLSYDIAQLERYQHENGWLPQEKVAGRVVFYGDSITDFWGKKGTSFFPDKSNYVNRGISGQTTAQMLIRFRQDVIDLHPAVVVILAGTNDIAGNIGPSSLKMAADNTESMVELAKANGIRVVLCSLLPADHYNWRPDVHPAEFIKQFNTWMKKYAASKGVTYVDYYSAMANANGGLDAKLAKDGVHPTADGYAIMTPLAEAGITAALKKKP